MQFGLLEEATESHFLSSPGEVDLYAVALSPGDTFSASIAAQQAGSTLTSLLRVFDSSGTALAIDNQEGGDPQLTFQAATAGTYYLGVSSAPNNDYNPLVAGSGAAGGSTGIYTLDVSRRSGPSMPDLTGSSFRTGEEMAALEIRFRLSSRSRTVVERTRVISRLKCCWAKTTSLTARPRCSQRSRAASWWRTHRAGASARRQVRV